MDLPEFSEPRGKAVAAGPDGGIWRLMAYYAGLFGAFFFGPALWFPVVWTVSLCDGQWGEVDRSSFKYVGWWLLGALPLAPFALSLARAGWDVRIRVVVAALPGLVVGFVSGITLYLGGHFLYLTAGVLGLLLGLFVLGPCWWWGDAQGRALALLGIAPALWGLWYLATDWVARRFPEIAAALGVVSWLFQWEYLLALVAVGLGIGVLRLVRARRRRPGRSQPFPRDRDDLDGIRPEVTGDGVTA